MNWKAETIVDVEVIDEFIESVACFRFRCGWAGHCKGQSSESELRLGKVRRERLEVDAKVERIINDNNDNNRMQYGYKINK